MYNELRKGKRKEDGLFEKNLEFARNRREKFPSFFAIKEIEEVFIFGSYAKETASGKSDIDLIIISEGCIEESLFELIDDLESLFKKKIDAYQARELDTRFYNSIKKEMIKIYERRNTGLL